MKGKRCVNEEEGKTITTMAQLTGLTIFTVWKILKEKLKNYRSVSVPQKLTNAQKAARKAWCDKMIEKCEKILYLIRYFFMTFNL